MRQLIIVFLIALLITIFAASRAFWVQTHFRPEPPWGPETELYLPAAS